MKQLIFCLSLLMASCSSSVSPESDSDTGLFTDSVFGKGHASVFFFLSTDCPLCQSYSSAMAALQQKYSSKGVSFYAVFPANKVEEVELFYKDYQFRMDYFCDNSLVITNYFKAETTPQVFFTGNKGDVLYQGRIDDLAYEVGRKRTVATTHELEDAIQAYVQQQPIKIKFTEAIGCLIEK